MGFEAPMAYRMAKASDVTYYVGKAGGVKSCPFFEEIGFTDVPESIVAEGINAAVVGTTATEVIVAFRGTLQLEFDNWNEFVQSVLDWANDGEACLMDARYALGHVHKGFANSLDLLWNDVLAAVRARKEATKLPVVVVGHSKGGALATLAALRLKHELGVTPAAVYTYGSARTGDTPFARDYNAKIPHHWRFENADDLVPHLPPTALLLSFLAKADPRLATLSAHAYNHVRLLEFLNWSDGLDEDSSLLLDGQRMVHFAKLAADRQIRQVALDHSLENYYIPRLKPSA